MLSVRVMVMANRPGVAERKVQQTRQCNKAAAADALCRLKFVASVHVQATAEG